MVVASRTPPRSRPFDPPPPLPAAKLQKKQQPPSNSETSTTLSQPHQTTATNYTSFYNPDYTNTDNRILTDLSNPLSKSHKKKLPAQLVNRKKSVSYNLSETPLFDRMKFYKFIGVEKPVNRYYSKDIVKGTAGAPTSNKKEEVPVVRVIAPQIAVSSSDDDGLSASQIWSPKTLEEWHDTIPELATLSNLTSHLTPFLHPLKKLKPIIPLSKEYINSRIDIDEPLKGYQLRHRQTGWLQGFVTYTKFTVWTYDFKWDSKHTQSGVVNTQNTDMPVKGLYGRSYDHDNKLASELENMRREGSAEANGIVFSGVAEISLLGSLGCGEVLVRLVLEMLQLDGGYDYVVLQATDSSVTFYERFGFIRVGAVTRYDNTKGNRKGMGGRLVGYRHWTYADEKSLEVHGGASYMMGLRLKDLKKGKAPLYEKREMYVVEDKPGVMSEEEFKEEGKGDGMYGENDFTVQKCLLDEESGVKVVKKRVRDRSGKKRKLAAAAALEKEKEKVASSSSVPVAVPISSSASVPVAANAPAAPVENVNKRSKTTKSSALWLAVTVADFNNKDKEPKERKGPRDRGLPIPPRGRESTGIGTGTSSKSGGDGSGCGSESGSNNGNDESKAPTLMKQRLINPLPLTSPNYFNKVIALKNTPRSSSSYYFVVNFDYVMGLLSIVRLCAGGYFVGRRGGRIKWRAVCNNDRPSSPSSSSSTSSNSAEVAVNDNSDDSDGGDRGMVFDESGLTVVNMEEWDVVPSCMVGKTPVVGREGWDVFDEDESV